MLQRRATEMARIVIADDDPHIREVVSFALESAGHRVTAREDGRSALDSALAEAPDLVVLDIMMPDLDGIEVCRRIREKSAVPILFLSAKDEEIDKIILEEAEHRKEVEIETAEDTGIRRGDI